MSRPKPVLTLCQLAEAIDARLVGDADLPIDGVGSLAAATPSQITFFTNARYREALQVTRAGAVIVSEAMFHLVPAGRAALVCAEPYLAFARVATCFHPRPSFAAGIDPNASIDPGARVDPSATVMAFVTVAEGAVVGPGAVLFPQVYLGADSHVGAQAMLYPGVVVREGCRIGARAIVHPGAVIGADGFGFAFDASGPSHFKIPQSGNVEIGDDVEIGANTAIDRAATGTTRVGAGSKIDNLVQIGHNVEIGPLCILCGQVGIAGSAHLGAGVVAGGQAGIAGHLSIADRTRIGAQAGVITAIDEPGEYLGTPAVKARTFFRSHLQTQKVPELARELRELRERVAQLEALLLASRPQRSSPWPSTPPPSLPPEQSSIPPSRSAPIQSSDPTSG